MPVSVSILDQSANPRDFTKASFNLSSKSSDAKALRATAVSELRALSTLLSSSHARLTRTHGVEMVTSSAPLKMVNCLDGQAFSRTEPPTMVLVSEFVEGGTLRNRVKADKLQQRREQQQQRVGEGYRRLDRRRLLADIATGLTFLHGRGVVHGALSTENILMGSDERPKVGTDIAPSCWTSGFD